MMRASSSSLSHSPWDIEEKILHTPAESVFEFMNINGVTLSMQIASH
jgi:hypothetical protein